MFFQPPARSLLSLNTRARSIRPPHQLWCPMGRIPPLSNLLSVMAILHRAPKTLIHILQTTPFLAKNQRVVQRPSQPPCCPILLPPSFIQLPKSRSRRAPPWIILWNAPWIWIWYLRLAPHVRTAVPFLEERSLTSSDSTRVQSYCWRSL